MGLCESSATVKSRRQISVLRFANHEFGNLGPRTRMSCSGCHPLDPFIPDLLRLVVRPGCGVRVPFQFDHSALQRQKVGPVFCREHPVKTQTALVVDTASAPMSGFVDRSGNSNLCTIAHELVRTMEPLRHMSNGYDSVLVSFGHGCPRTPTAAPGVQFGFILAR